MGRILKKGIDYFTLTSNLVDDSCMQSIISLHGYGAISVYVAIICDMFKTNTYLIKDFSSPANINKFCRKLKISKKKFTTILDALIQHDFFDKSSAKFDNILYSDDIKHTFDKIQEKREIALSKYNDIKEKPDYKEKKKTAYQKKKEKQINKIFTDYKNKLSDLTSVDLNDSTEHTKEIEKYLLSIGFTKNNIRDIMSNFTNMILINLIAQATDKNRDPVVTSPKPWLMSILSSKGLKFSSDSSDSKPVYAFKSVSDGITDYYAGVYKNTGYK